MQQPFVRTLFWKNVPLLWISIFFPIAFIIVVVEDSIQKKPMLQLSHQPYSQSVICQDGLHIIRYNTFCRCLSTSYLQIAQTPSCLTKQCFCDNLSKHKTTRITLVLDRCMGQTAGSHTRQQAVFLCKCRRTDHCSCREGIVPCCATSFHHFWH